MRRLWTASIVTILAVALAATPAAGGGGGGGGGSGGPLILMGLDAEDGGAPSSNHGDDSIFVGLLQSLLADVNKSGSGIVVVGGGKGAEHVTEWWTYIATQAGVSVTFVNGAANISSFDFKPFRLIGVASDDGNSTGDGLTQEEHDAFAARASDVQAFVRSGGGVFGLNSEFDPTVGAPPYAYITGAAAGLTARSAGYEDVTSTPEGQAVGITDDNLDVDAWHVVFTAFPDFLKVLATQNEPGDAENFGLPAAIGGERVLGGNCPGAKNAKGNHIVGTKKKDVIRGTRERDVICGLGGNDRLLGKFGNDLILGGSGDDTILGGHGNDKLKGEDGNDLIRGMVGADKHIGGPGTDRCNGGRGNDSFKTCENKN